MSKSIGLRAAGDFLIKIPMDTSVTAAAADRITRCFLDDKFQYIKSFENDSVKANRLRCRINNHNLY